jgi:sporulation protein YabP
MGARAEASGHSLQLTDRNQLTVDGVSKVESFDRQQVVLVTALGMLEVRGEDLHMRSLDLEGGHCHLDGRVDGLNYRQAATPRERGGALRRLLR